LVSVFPAAALQGSLLDGHKLALQLSTHKTAAAAAGAKAAGKGKGGKASLPDTTKMVVLNVAFEAIRKDIIGLFTPFGHVKSCRLPRKFDGTHKWAQGLVLWHVASAGVGRGERAATYVGVE
jgi:hypothetical protein